MQPNVKDPKSDPVRKAHEDTDEKATGEKTEEEERIDRIANKMAGRGLERERKDDEGRDEFTGVGGNKG